MPRFSGTPVEEAKVIKKPRFSGTPVDGSDDPRNSVLGHVDAAMRGAADSLSLGLADEITAQARSGPLTVQEKPEEYYDRGIFAGDYNPLGKLARLLDAPFASETKNADYDKALAEERAVDDADYEKRFFSRLGGQVGGAITGGVGLAKAGLSPTAKAVEEGKNLLRVSSAAAGEGAVLGTAQGFGSGEGFQDRLLEASKGFATGLGLGAVSPAVGGAVSKVFGGVTAPIMSRLYPDEYASKALGEGVKRSGKTVDDLARLLTEAGEDGQGMFTVADAMGNSGQRMLSTVGRTPNDSRQQVVDDLISRQMDQGRRVANSLTDASGTPWTAERYGEVLKTRRAMEADANYGPVKRDTSAIDVSGPVDVANRSISPIADNIAKANASVPTDLAARASMEAGEASIRDPIRQAIKEARSYLASDTNTVTNVEKAFRAKTNIDQMIAKATENGQGAMVAELMPIQKSLDDALARTSKTYAGARDAYEVSSGNIDAIDAGRQMARPRNRVDDNIANFRGMTDDQQKAARVGYFDPQIAKAEDAAGKMTNSARPFTAESARRELPVFSAPGEGERLMRRLGREQTMSETTAQALGGSRTADNMADMAEMARFDPGVISSMLRGDIPGAMLSGASRALNEAQGMPPSVVDRLATILMQTDPAQAMQALTAGAGKVAGSDRAKASALASLLSLGGAAAGRF